MFVPCTVLLYDSTAATQTIKLSTTLLSISRAIRLISFLVMSSLVCGLFSQTLPFRSPLENSQAGWDIGNRMARGYRFDVKWVCPMGSYAWSIQVFCSGWWFQMRWCLISRTGHLNTSGITSHGTDSFHVKPMTPGHPIPKISTCLTIFWVCENNPQTREDIIRKEIKRIAQEMLYRIVDNFVARVAAHTAAQCMERTWY